MAQNVKEYVNIIENLQVNEKYMDIFESFIETYIEKYGEENIDFVLSRFENLRLDYKADYTNSHASAMKKSIVISKKFYDNQEKLEFIIYHELWHILNQDEKSPDRDIRHMPEKYRQYLQKIWNIEDIDYLNTIKEYYGDVFPEDKMSSVQENEKYTNYFAERHMDTPKNIISSFRNGFYIQDKERSAYNYFQNTVPIIECLMSEHDIHNMYTNSDGNDTGLTYEQYIEDFDYKYENALSDDEKQKYYSPYYKIMIDAIEIDSYMENGERLKAAYKLADSLKTLFRAYNIKLERNRPTNEQELEKIRDEIILMQSNMLFNLDFKKMKELPYMAELFSIKEQYEKYCTELGREDLKQDISLDGKFKNADQYRDLINAITRQDGVEVAVKSKLYQAIEVLFAEDTYNYINGTEVGAELNSMLTEEERLLYGNMFDKVFSSIKDAKTPVDFQNIRREIIRCYEQKINVELDPDKLDSYPIKRFKINKDEIIHMGELLDIDGNDNESIDSLGRIVNRFSIIQMRFNGFIDDCLITPNDRLKIAMEEDKQTLNSYSTELNAYYKSRQEAILDNKELSTVITPLNVEGATLDRKSSRVSIEANVVSKGIAQKQQQKEPVE